MPAIYVNDNFGQWRSDFRRRSRTAPTTIVAGPARVAAAAARPTRDYFVLKPKHSGFFGTTLDTLLENLGSRRAHPDRHRRQHLRAVHRQRRLHARVRHLRAGRLQRLEHQEAENDYALVQMQTVLKADITSSTRLDLLRLARGEENLASPTRRSDQ